MARTPKLKYQQQQSLPPPRQMSNSKLKKLKESLKRRRSDVGSSSQPQLLAPPTPPRPASALGTSSSSSVAPQTPLFTSNLSPQASAIPTPSIMVHDPVGSPNASLPPATPEDTPPGTPAKKHKTLSSNSAFGELCVALQSLHVGTKLFPPLHSVVGKLVSCFKELEATSQHRRDYEDMTLDLVALSKSLKEYTEKSKTTRMSEFIENIALRITEQIQQIEAKRDRSTGRYLIDANEEDVELTRWYRRIGALFRQLQLDVNLSTLEVLDEQLTDHRLEAMAPVKLAVYNSIISIDINRRGCTEGTRVQVLFDLDNWAHTPGTPNIYWMNGMAGTGKTTIAYTFAQRLKGRKSLGASFFCTRTTAECGNVGRIFPTIAYQLARYSTPFRSSLCRVLGNDRDLGSQTLTAQFEELLVKPLLEVKDVIPEGLVIIVDALDECSNKGGTELVLDILFEHATKLPLKFFVTSRPEPHIRNSIRIRSEHLRSVFILHEIESSLVQEDIELYLREELASMSPADTQVERLAELSGNLFIYAATAVRYIQSNGIFSTSSPTERLAMVFHASSKSNKRHAEIDDLYTTILSSVLHHTALEQEDKEQIQIILWTVVCACEPLDIETLSKLTKIKHSTKTLAILQPLYSVLYVSERNNIVSTLHASFPDYMLDRSRSLGFHCDKNANHERLSRRCLELMEELRFNICEIPSSFVADEAVEGLENRIESTLSNSLLYACRYWGNHIQSSVPSEPLFELIWNFLSHKLLFWTEVLNLKHIMGTGIGTLNAARMWMMKSHLSHHGNLLQLTQDSDMFLTKFFANPVSQSTPHIYISALPSCPKSSLVFQIYWGRTTGLLTIDSPALEEQGVSSLAIWETKSEIHSLSVSPDGTQLAVGHYNGSITVRHAHQGGVISDPVQIHFSTVNSLAFSPDGTRFVSGSFDPSICIWNANNGSLIASSQVIGHTGPVYSVGFSSDGQYIISGSSDCSIRTWDAYTCLPIANPLRVHTHEINSVACSPDNRHIAFGSDDHTVQICSFKDGSVIFEPCRGHASLIWTVIYSPDGTCIASGSRDSTVRIWNARDATLLYGPFVRHTGAIQSIAFSPNGVYLASASSERDICIWNVCDGAILGNPLTRHQAPIKSLTFSHDGSRIFSGSTDGTIRVWGVPDQLTSAPIAVTQKEGHSGQVCSVGFSSDGTYLVSCSLDGTIRTWSAHDGSDISDPLIKHNSGISTMALSPNNAHIAYGSVDYTVRICDARSGTLVVGPCRGHTSVVESVAYSSDGSLVVSGSQDHTLRIWRADSGALVSTPLEGHTDAVCRVAISPDGGQIASGSFDHTLRIWKLRNGQYEAFKCLKHPFSVQGVAFSPDSARIASGSEANTIRIWNAESGDLDMSIRQTEINMSEITALEYSSDGTYIISGSYQGVVAVWNACNGALIAGPFSGHTGYIRAVACSPNGEYIASGSVDKTIRIWKLKAPFSNAMSADFPGLVGTRTGGSLTPALKNGFNIGNDGWIKSNNSQLLFWVPSDLDLTDVSPSLQTPIIITPRGPLTIDFNNLLLGEDWTKCYLSE